MLEQIWKALCRFERIIFGLFLLPIYPVARPVAVWADKGHSDISRFFRTLTLIPIFGIYWLVFLFAIGYLGLLEIPDIFIQ